MLPKNQVNTREPFLANHTNRKKSDRSQSYAYAGAIIGVAAVASIGSLITLSLVLAIPITVLVIGVRYQDPRYCPIEPRISLFLIVDGSVLLALISVRILAQIVVLICVNRHPRASSIILMVLSALSFIHFIFSCTWWIIGGVWTFSVKTEVTHVYDTENNFYTYDYCHPVLYKFTFVYLIIVYIVAGLACCDLCFYISVWLGRKRSF